MGFSVDRAILACISPSGKTARVMAIVQDTLDSLGIRSRLFRIGKKQEENTFLEKIQADGVQLIFLGSPVYVNQPLPQVMDLISRMGERPNAVVIPFVTWGCVSSGLALHAMVEALSAKNFIVPAAFKVPAQHSLMWAERNPLGLDRPDMDDERKIRNFVLFMVKRLLKEGPAGTLPLEQLLDQPRELIEDMQKAGLNTAKAHFPVKQVDEIRCELCGMCAEGCPVEAISLDPLPVFNDSCIWCFQCVKECPQKAIPIDLSARMSMIRQRALDLNEPSVMKSFSTWADIFT